MNKLIAAFVTFILLFVFAVIGLTNYLGPDDLKSCDGSPNIAQGKNCDAADAIVAISGGDTYARTQEAIRLYQNGWAPKLIFSGAAFDQNGPSNAEEMGALAIEAGVPEEDIILNETARDTLENASQTREVAEKQGINKIILVTSGYHQRRASISFVQAFDKQSVINHPAPDDEQWESTWWLTPHGWWLALSEMAKIAVTTFKGGN